MVLEIVWYSLSGLLIAAGMIGCILPVVPGPLLAGAGLLIASAASGWIAPETWVLVTLLAFAVATMLFDSLLPPVSGKRAGAGRAGVLGSVVGMIVGTVFFPPFGTIVGALAGAFIGEIVAQGDSALAWKAAVAVFRGTLLAMVLKLSASGAIAVAYVRLLISSF